MPLSHCYRKSQNEVLLRHLYIIVRVDKSRNTISMPSLAITPDMDTCETLTTIAPFPLKHPFVKFKGPFRVCPCVGLVSTQCQRHPDRSDMFACYQYGQLPGIIFERPQGMPILSSRLFARSLSQPRCLGSSPCTQDSGKAEKPSRQPRKAPARQQLTLLWPPCIASRLMVDLDGGRGVPHRVKISFTGHGVLGPVSLL